MKVRKFIASVWVDVVALIVIGIVFVVPFVFIFLTAAKTRQEAALFEFSWPSKFQLIENIRDGHDVWQQSDAPGAVEQHAPDRGLGHADRLVLGTRRLRDAAPQRSGGRRLSVRSCSRGSSSLRPSCRRSSCCSGLVLYKTLFGLIMVEVAFTMPFATLIFRAFMASIPSEIDEAAIIDGASPLRVFFSIILPLLRPAIVTVIVVSSVGIYNDFAGPLYFLPGAQNVTAQLTLYSFMSQFSSQWNLLFADVVVITIPPLIMFMFFQRQIVSGMTAGAVKG